VFEKIMSEAAKLSGWRNCAACGHHNGAWESRCEKCGRRLHAGRAPSAAVPKSVSASDPPRAVASPKIVPPPPAFPEHLRQQLQNRVQRFRTRQEGRTMALPFEEEAYEPSPKIITFPAPPAAELVSEPAPAPLPRTVREARRPEPAAISAQPIFDFYSEALEEQVWRLRPVAPLRVRIAAHLRDLQLVIVGSLLFCAALLIVPRFGIRLQPSMILLGGVICGLLILPLLYGLLFVWGSGVTPGMKAAGLRLVSFDGMPAPRRRRLWRVFGAVVSAGSFLIGFLWAAVDEEKLYWHDHISKTYLTLSDS
jgi:uncharacterized RDD family membrane protein YckC